MLLASLLFYYGEITKRWSASYLAEDADQAIIGIDCEYFSSSDFSELRSYFASESARAIAPFAGLFGVLSWQATKSFEPSVQIGLAPYEFAPFVFANARAYLHYDKASKTYTFYGDESRYLSVLTQLKEEPAKESEFEFEILSDLEQERSLFEQAVLKAKQYIAQGDAFQIVLSSQLKARTNISELEFYRRLSRANPSPYMFCYPSPYGTIVGSSPELVFSLYDRRIFVAPIAGTAPRSGDVLKDEATRDRLLSDPKELAEHRMLIDLARNDISRVAEPTSVLVKNAMQVEFYERVMHIQSEVYGRLKQGLDGFDAIASIFPAGTLSGAPKIRAMQIIAELEASGRGVYGGGLGFLHFNGDVQLAILIRSAFFAKASQNEFKELFIGAGAGVVYDSDPQKEYNEIRHKRASLLGVLQKGAK